MKKVIFSMKAFYISLFVVLFFPLGLMGQEPINTKINTGSIICFESKGNMMAVDIYPESHAYAGLPYLSARAKNDQVWGDMTIWWEATDKGFRNLTYGCYLKFDSDAKTYAVAMYEDPDGEEGPEVPRAYSESDATQIGFVTATEDAKVLVKMKTLLGTDLNSFDNKSSWYVGKIFYDETIAYEESYYEWFTKKWRRKTFTNHVNEYYRPQYVNGEWVARTNVGKRKLTGYDLLDHNEILKYTERYQLLSFLFEKEIQNQGEITYSPNLILGGIEFGEIIGIDMRKLMAFFCPPTDAQAYMLNNFNVIHQKGASAPAEYQQQINYLQPVHTHTEVIYAADGEDVHLRLQVEDTRSYPLDWGDPENSILYQYTANKYLDGYYRWFNYKNENNTKTINDSLKHIRAKTTWGMNLGETEEFKYFKTNKGDVLLKGFGPGKTTFKMGKDSVKIACDVSNYSDYKFSFVDGVITCIEPTLSYRIIYDIHPAKKMAEQLDGCTTTPLESYTIVAPVPVPTDPNKKEGKQITIGPKYRWTGNSCNYYFNKSNPARITSPTWYKNGDEFNQTVWEGLQQVTQYEIIDDRLISIEGPNEDGKIDTYTLKSGDLIIAEFKVVGRDINKVGPLKTKILFPKGYNPDDPSSLTPVYTETFDREYKNEFEQPLPWDNISYGFVYYNVTGANVVFKDLNKYKGRKGSGDKSALLSHWSEYSLVDRASSSNTDVIFNVLSKSKSYQTNELNRFLYCSGTNTPSKVADFVINGDLCPASKIFLSAWVVHTYDVSEIDDNASVYPNLNFSIIGIMNDGTETLITTFTTGDLDTKNGAISDWHHIFFEFETTQVDYDQYRIRIENNNASLFNIGNEFGIDDIRVWTTTKTAATISQRFMSCSDWSLETKDQIGKSNIALLRAELDNTPATGATMYYAWLKKDGVNDTISLELQNYIGQSPTSRYGTIYVNKGWTEENAPDQVKAKFYDDVNDYLADIEGRTGDFSDYFFTRENNELVLYIVHKDKLFQQNEKYYSIVTTLDLSNKDLVKLYQNLQCGTLSYFEVLPYSRAFLAKKEGEVYKKYGDYDFTEAITKHLADGETYNFVVEAYSPAVIDGRDTIVSYNCHADWLLVTDDDTKWTDAKNIIDWQANRDAQLTLSKGNSLKTSDGSVTSFPVNFSGPLHYIAIPDKNKAFIPDPNNPNVFYTPCAIPIEIYLYDSIPATLADPNVSDAVKDENGNGWKWKYDRPKEICNEPIIVRIPYSLVKDNGNIALNLDIDYFDEYLFAEIAKYNEKENEKTQDANPYPLSEIYLYDENKQLKFNITTTAKDENNQTLTLDLLKKNDDVSINKADGATLSFESGEKYHFAGHNVVNGVTITPPFQFDVYVVPDEVEWTGAEGTAWHKDANWDPAIIPMSHTNVVIPNTTKKPVLKPSATEFESGAYKWFEHDIVAVSKGDNNLLVEAQSDDLSAVLNSCNDIYFEAGAQLANQHMLNYERAFVDVPFTGDDFGKSNDNFKIMSFPLRNVYRGDLYIPKAGDGTFAFASPADVDNRAYNSFYVKAYDSAIKQNHVVNNNGKNEVESSPDEYNYENTSWSNPTSVLNFEFEEAHGYAVSLNANTAQSFVHLPKSATEYYLFMNFGNGNEKELHGSTWPKYEISWEADNNNNRPAHDGREFAHKLVYGKDPDDKVHGESVTFTNKQGNIFLIGNPFMTSMNVKEFLAGNNTNLNSNVYYTYSDGIINVNVTPEATDIIPPFGAMFVEGKTNSVKQTFKFTPAMMSYTESTESSTRAPRMVEERELLTITAEVDGARSRTYIEKDFAANNEYLDTEDADLLVLDADLTPISVYSVATGAALAYNSVTDMEFVPLGLLLVDSTIVAESVRFTFDGVDYFYDELYLYDALYNSYLPLIDGVALELEMPESGELRYFITDTKHNVGGGVATSDDLVEGSKVCVFTTEGEACIIAEDIISEATVYDIAGRLIYYSDQISSSQHNISLPNGVYMLKVVVNSNLSTHKIILK